MSNKIELYEDNAGGLYVVTEDAVYGGLEQAQQLGARFDEDAADLNDWTGEWDETMTRAEWEQERFEGNVETAYAHIATYEDGKVTVHGAPGLAGKAYLSIESDDDGEDGITDWRDLMVYDADGEYWGDLGGIVSGAPANFDNADIAADGEIVGWEGFFIAAPGEDHDADTPRGEVSWDGLREALGR